jgi:hypothetical protein
MNQRLLLVGLLAAAVILSGCAGPNPLIVTVRQHGVAGFFTGLWHGMICPIVFVVSLFKRGVNMYEVHNNGAWYNAGFLIGAGAWGILRGSSRAKVGELADHELLKEVERRRLDRR